MVVIELQCRMNLHPVVEVVGVVREVECTEVGVGVLAEVIRLTKVTTRDLQ